MILPEERSEKRHQKCVECGDRLTMEMERDSGICVCCQEERAITREEIDDDNQKYSIIPNSAALCGPGETTP